MEGDSPSQPGQLETKELLEGLYQAVNKSVVESSTTLQQHLNAEFSSTRGVLTAMQKDLETVKTMFGTQREYLQSLLAKISAEENESKADDYEIIPNENLQSGKIAALEASNRDLRAKLAETANSTNNEQIQRSLATANKNLADSEARQRSLRIQIGRLQTHITKNASNANELIDSEVNGKIEWIKARTQAIVKKYCVEAGSPPSRDLTHTTEFRDNDLEWKRKCARLHYSESGDDEIFCTYWVRSKIYSIMEKMIFNQRVFGLEQDLDDKLAEFERLIAKRSSESDVADWRALTIQYGRLLEMNNPQFSERVASHMENLFHPWMPEKCGNVHVVKISRIGPKITRERPPTQLHLDLIEICQAAYSLTVMLRQSRDRYTFVAVPEEKVVETIEDENYEAEDMNGPKAKYIGSKVWVCLFGALVKEPVQGERHVMVKARVICRATKGLAEHSRVERSVSPMKKMSESR